MSTHLKGYQFDEARSLLEFCLDLDSQDDRLGSPSAEDARFTAVLDTALWENKAAFDSRDRVAADLVNYLSNPQEPSLAAWSKLFQGTYKKGEAWSKRTGKTIRWDSAEYIASNPVLNGFGPYQNAWTLHKGVGEFSGAYVVAIRGTVFSNAPSALEDFILNPVQAGQFLSPSVRFAKEPYAAIHSGFAHGAFSMLLDEKYGIVPVVLEKVPKGSRLFITGHSQGAALATLVHAFLHHAQSGADDSDVFKLREAAYPLKSYVYAQPKPGDSVFAADFAHFTQRDDSAIVINNVIDPVPMVPLAIQSIHDVTADLPQKSLWIKALQSTLRGLSFLVRGIGSIVEISVRKHAADYGNYYKHNDGLMMNSKLDKSADTLNFTSAGHVFNLFGMPVDSEDLFMQHHAYVYRKLLSEQLSP